MVSGVEMEVILGNGKLGQNGYNRLLVRSATAAAAVLSA